MPAPSREMFTRIAPCYDALNRVMTCGIDVWWRRRALALLSRAYGNEPPAAILDEATGTADLALGLARRFPAAHIVGLDATCAMLAVGREKVARAGLDARIALQEGDAEALPFPEATFDAVTCAFGYRNFPHRKQALAEAARVLKPNGRLLVIELFRIENRFFSWLTSFWLRLVVRFLARARKGDYTYLRASIETTDSAPEFIRSAQEAGFRCEKESFYIPSCRCLCFEKYGKISI